MLPTNPLVGISENSASTVKLVDAELMPSVARINWAPFGTAGIVTGQTKPPVLFDAQLEGAETESNVKVMVWPGRKPAPVAVVVLPTIPLDGFTARDAPAGGLRTEADPRTTPLDMPKATEAMAAQKNHR